MTYYNLCATEYALTFACYILNTSIQLKPKAWLSYIILLIECIATHLVKGRERQINPESRAMVLVLKVNDTMRSEQWLSG